MELCSIIESIINNNRLIDTGTNKKNGQTERKSIRIMRIGFGYDALRLGQEGIDT